MNNQKTREVLAKSLKQGKTPFGESETENTPHPCLPKVFFNGSSPIQLKRIGDFFLNNE
jgi:hypothetical protein